MSYSSNCDESTNQMGFESTVGADAFSMIFEITAESDWNAYNIPTLFFTQICIIYVFHRLNLCLIFDYFLLMYCFASIADFHKSSNPSLRVLVNSLLIV